MADDRGRDAGCAPIVAVATEHTLWMLPLLALPFLGVRHSARIAMRSDHAAVHDALTGLPNRALFRDRVDQAHRARAAHDRRRSS